MVWTGNAPSPVSGIWNLSSHLVAIFGETMGRCSLGGARMSLLGFGEFKGSDHFHCAIKIWALRFLLLSSHLQPALLPPYHLPACHLPPCHLPPCHHDGLLVLCSHKPNKLDFLSVASGHGAYSNREVTNTQDSLFSEQEIRKYHLPSPCDPEQRTVEIHVFMFQPTGFQTDHNLILSCRELTYFHADIGRGMAVNWDWSVTLFLYHSKDQNIKIQSQCAEINLRWLLLNMNNLEYNFSIYGNLFCFSPSSACDKIYQFKYFI